ncbi:MAG: monovalent cation/H(+) antiporter subunit G [Chromatiales bacterium]|jgi:multicomponent Na+:H+ antiporter subunit G
MIDLIGSLLMIASVAFFAAGSIGLLRLPDVHARLHALTKADNLGLGLLVAGAALISGDLLFALKLIGIWLLVMASSSISAYMIARNASAEEEDAPWK